MTIQTTLASLIERLRKPGVMGAIGIRRMRSCRKDLASYFRFVANRVQQSGLSNLATSEDKEVALHSANMQISNILRLARPLFIMAMQHHLAKAYVEGWTSAQIHPHVGRLREADDDVTVDPPTGSELDQLGPSGERAADFAATEAADLIQGIDETTLSKLQDAIAQGIEDKLGVDGLARLLRDTIEGMTLDRAKIIATTEMNRAFSTAALEKMDAIGIEYKRWIPVDDPCEICEDNEADGAIPVDEDFSSGDPAPPAHPNCRCAVVGARAPE